MCKYCWVKACNTFPKKKNKFTDSNISRNVCCVWAISGAWAATILHTSATLPKNVLWFRNEKSFQLQEAVSSDNPLPHFVFHLFPKLRPDPPRPCLSRGVFTCVLRCVCVLRNNLSEVQLKFNMRLFKSVTCCFQRLLKYLTVGYLDLTLGELTVPLRPPHTQVTCIHQ